MTSRTGLPASTTDAIGGPSPPAASGTGRLSPARAAAGWALLAGLTLGASTAGPARADTTERASVGPGGRQANGHSFNASLSFDGRYVAFESIATDLVPGAGNGKGQVYLRDRRTGAIELVSVGTDGAPGDGNSGALITISADERYVAFTSEAANLVPGDTNGAQDVFVRTR